VVKAGWIWAGRPAFAFRAIKPQEREAFAEAAQIYVGYGAAYRRGQLVAPLRSGR
jgi:carbonic anhydrase/acetyltransferase-like protein (isoleucine patch superfamily)